MEPTTTVTRPHAKYFFLHLGIIALLYTAVTTFLSFCFDVINYLFPDRQAYAFDPYTTSLRLSVSVLIVVFPVLIYLARLVYRELVAHPEDRHLSVQKWLSFFTLFLAALTIIIDAIVLLNTFFNGEISSRFIAKFAVVLIVAFVVFWYTIRDLKGVYFEKPHLLKLFTYIVSAVVFASIIGGLFIMGSPATQRMLRDDMDRQNDLSSIQSQVLNYYQNSGKLPESINVLKDDFSYYNEETFVDPATKNQYDYKVVTGTTSISFELCADFDLDSTTNDMKGRGDYKAYSSLSIDYYGFGSSFEHVKGKNCYTRTIDPVKHPVYNQVPKNQ
ncbi:MAG: hypothetical protein RLY57_74 [Candidatus Parcubacteria bacterium]|jgi:hypothetical protein